MLILFLYWNNYSFGTNKYEDLIDIIFFLFEFFHTIVSSYLNKKNSIIFFPYLIYLFFFVFFFNIIGLVPGVFAATSHLLFTLMISINIWLVIITLGFSIKTIKFLNIIIPKNIPGELVPFLIFIEFVSYFFRFISLSLRLFANILAGHILIHVLTGASTKILISIENSILYIYIFIILFFAFSILFFFEIIVAFLQGYILFILSVIYLTDLEISGNH